MKHLGNLLITISLIVGVLAAATSYFVPLNLSDSAYDGLKLGAEAGRYDPLAPDNQELHKQVNQLHAQLDEQAKEGEPEPLLPLEPPVVLSGEDQAIPALETAPTGAQIVADREAIAIVGRSDDALTPELLTILRQRENPDGSPQVRGVKVSRFSLGRWRYSWLFALALVGLGAGAAMVRVAAKRSIALAQAQPGSKGAPRDTAQLLASAVRQVTELRESLPLIPGSPGRMHQIITRLGDLQQNELVDIVASRPLFVARHGLSGYAAFMDHFAGAERQVNRAWSAAADGVEEEALACVDMAEALLKQTEEKLTALEG